MFLDITIGLLDTSNSRLSNRICWLDNKICCLDITISCLDTRIRCLGITIDDLRPRIGCLGRFPVAPDIIWQVLGISWRLWGWLWSPGSEVIRSGGGKALHSGPYSQTSKRWNGGYHDIKQMEWRTLRHQDQDSCDILIHLNLIEAGLYIIPHSLVAPKGAGGLGKI